MLGVFPKDFPWNKVLEHGYMREGWAVRVQKLKHITQDLLRSGKYKKNTIVRNGKEKTITFCNRFALIAAKKFGASLKEIADNDLWRSCTTMWKRADKMWKVTPELAHELAAIGVMIFVVSPKYMRVGKLYYNHTAIVYPELTKTYDPEKGPRIIQEGGVGGEFYISEWQAWGKHWQNEYVRYVVLPYKG